MTTQFVLGHFLSSYGTRRFALTSNHLTRTNDRGFLDGFTMRVVSQLTWKRGKPCSSFALAGSLRLLRRKLKAISL